MKKIILFTTLLFISFASFSQEKEITEMLEKQRLNWNKGDLTAYMQDYQKSDSIIFVSKFGPIYGWQKISANNKKYYPDKATMGNLTLDIKQIKMIDKKNALVLGAWNIKSEKDESKGFFTLIVEKFKDGWKIVVDHSSW